VAVSGRLTNAGFNGRTVSFHVHEPHQKLDMLGHDIIVRRHWRVTILLRPVVCTPIQTDHGELANSGLWLCFVKDKVRVDKWLELRRFPGFMTLVGTGRGGIKHREGIRIESWSRHHRLISWTRVEGMGAAIRNERNRAQANQRTSFNRGKYADTGR